MALAPRRHRASTGLATLASSGHAARISRTEKGCICEEARDALHSQIGAERDSSLEQAAVNASGPGTRRMLLASAAVTVARVVTVANAALALGALEKQPRWCPTQSFHKLVQSNHLASAPAELYCAQGGPVWKLLLPSI